MTRVTTKDFTYRFSNGGSGYVPAGSPVTPITGDTLNFWVDPKIYPAGSIERHDAEHYGIRVPGHMTWEIDDEGF